MRRWAATRFRPLVPILKVTSKPEFCPSIKEALLTFSSERSSVQNVTSTAPQFFTDLGSKRVQVNYGPFSVPNMNIDNGMRQYTMGPVEIGCKNCTITYLQGGLEYPNGTYANANTSLWLHHVVLYNLNNLDTVCGANVPGERFFASGNERSPLSICTNG